MAELIDKIDATQHLPSNAKTNTALTLGIIGTAIGALGLMKGSGRGGLLGGLLCGCGGETNSQAVAMSAEDLYIERQQCAQYLETTKRYYEGQISNIQSLNAAFNDITAREHANSFGLYKYSRDLNDELSAKIDAVDKKVDVMAAIRPYQDALIDSKINQTALMADYNLFKRTCKMMTGQLVLPSTPVVTGYGSYNYFSCAPSTTDSTTTA